MNTDFHGLEEAIWKPDNQKFRIRVYLWQSVARIYAFP